MTSQTAPPRLTPKFTEAMSYAAEKHGNQTRKGGDIPYLGHLLSVVGYAIEQVAPRRKPSPHCCTTPPRTRAAKGPWRRSGRSSATTSRRSSPNAATRSRPEAAVARA
jgi:hypothetical protein